MILLDKTLEQIMSETLDELQGAGIDQNAGSVARLLVSIMNKHLSTFYDTLKINHAQAFVSTAKDIFLDYIGQLLDCERLEEEANDDDAYRYRITKQIQVVASANRMAIRLAALSVEGVQDVILKRFTHGTGSFSVYVVSEDPVTSDELLDAVQEKIDEVEAYGVRGEVFRPILKNVEMKLRLVFRNTVPDLDRKLTISQVQEELKNYINGLNTGDSIIMTDINRLATDIYDKIEEVIIFNFKINNRPVLPVDQSLAWNERFIESDKPNALQVL